jgi:hypothetical protein
VRTVPRLCELYSGICLKTEEKARKNLSRGCRRKPVGTTKTEYTEQSIQTIIIHKHDNKNTYLTELNKSVQQYTTIYTTIEKRHYTETLLHTSPNYTTLHLSTLHFLSFTLHYPIIWFNPITFSTTLFPSHH